jgi:hypothetical protein
MALKGVLEVTTSQNMHALDYFFPSKVENAISTEALPFAADIS